MRQEGMLGVGIQLSTRGDSGTGLLCVHDNLTVGVNHGTRMQE
jgi:hypothetical protein